MRLMSQKALRLHFRCLGCPPNLVCWEWKLVGIYLHSIRCRMLGLFAGRCGASSAILSATAMPDTILDLLVLLVLFAVTLSLFSGLMLHRSRSQWCESLSFLPLLICSDVESIQTSDESISIVCLCPLVSNCLDFVPHFLSRSLSKTSFCQF